MRVLFKLFIFLYVISFSFFLPISSSTRAVGPAEKMAKLNEYKRLMKFRERTLLELEGTINLSHLETQVYLELGKYLNLINEDFNNCCPIEDYVSCDPDVVRIKDFKKAISGSFSQISNDKVKIKSLQEKTSRILYDGYIMHKLELSKPFLEYITNTLDILNLKRKISRAQEELRASCTNIYVISQLAGKINTLERQNGGRLAYSCSMPNLFFCK